MQNMDCLRVQTNFGIFGVVFCVNIRCLNMLLYPFIFVWVVFCFAVSLKCKHFYFQINCQATFSKIFIYEFIFITPIWISKKYDLMHTQRKQQEETTIYKFSVYKNDTAWHVQFGSPFPFLGCVQANFFDFRFSHFSYLCSGFFLFFSIFCFVPLFELFLLLTRKATAIIVPWISNNKIRKIHFTNVFRMLFLFIFLVFLYCQHMNLNILSWNLIRGFAAEWSSCFLFHIVNIGIKMTAVNIKIPMKFVSKNYLLHFVSNEKTKNSISIPKMCFFTFRCFRYFVNSQFSI